MPFTVKKEITIMEKQFTVVCQHCGRIIIDKGTKEVSHGDCAQYFDEPCENGKKYYIEQAQLIGMSYDEILNIAKGHRK
jgi:hypothetical protein